MKSLFLRWILLLTVILLPAWEMRGNPEGRDAPLPNATRSLTTIQIPGPLRSFLRMAAISQQVPADEVIPLLAHNVEIEGYRYNWKGREPHPTQYLILLKDYIKQARELRALAGSRQVIRISSCDQAGPLLKTLGYELTKPCGPDTSLETAVKERAFLTDDSGFPLNALERTLRGGAPFEYGFGSFKARVLFAPKDWMALDPNKKKNDDLLDALLSNPRLARLYWAVSRIDQNTRDFLRNSPGIKRLLPLAPVLDFYGSQINIRSGRVIAPGGKSAESAWTKLVGVGPDSPGRFVIHLLEKDKGWLAAYFDALSRVGPEQQAYLTQPRILEGFYSALVGKNASPGPARPVFRPDPGLLLLLSGIHLDGSGRLQIPGNLAVWKQVLKDMRHKLHSKLVREWTRGAPNWNTRDQLLECMVALSRADLWNGPLQAYLSLRALDHARPLNDRLSPATVRLLADDFAKFGDQYITFSEFPLSDRSIAQFIKVAESIDKIHDNSLRSDCVGIFQANVGIWKILARQGEIPQADWNRSWQEVIQPFSGIRTDLELYHATRTSTQKMLVAAGGSPDLAQNELIKLLAGPAQTSDAGMQVRTALANKIRSMMAAQSLVSLDTLFKLGDGLEQLAKGETPSSPLLPLAAQLRQFQLPKPLFTRGERAEWSMGLYSNQHIQAEMKTNLAKLIRTKPSADKLEAARGLLVPFLRDTLVGLNYAYYEPPGSQMIYHNSLFVRSHDFSGTRSMSEDRAWKTPDVFGRGMPAGGGAHLVGSLTDLPYALARVEEDFIVPSNVQALIWEDMVPVLMRNAMVPRWWNVTRNELHGVALAQSFGKELVRAAGTHPQLRREVMGILSDRMLPERFSRVEKELGEGRSNQALARLTPADTFCLAMEFRKKYPGSDPAGGEAGKELDELARLHPEEINWKRLSTDFGVPHPVVDQSDARSLINVKPFPTYLGYSSELLAESWESNNLYWARLAYQKGYPPVMLNLLVPQLTYRMVENISATYLDDWRSLLRSLRQTGKAFQQGKFASLAKMGRASGFFRLDTRRSTPTHLRPH